MPRNIDFHDIGSPAVGNGSAYFSKGADMFNRAFNIAQDGLTKHEQTLKENAQKAEMQATAKLSEIAKNGPLTQKDYDSVKFYDKMKLEEMINKNNKESHDQLMDTEKLGLDRQNIASQIAYRKAQIANAGKDGKMDPLSKMMYKQQLDQQTLLFKKKNGMLPGKGGKGSNDIDNIMERNGLNYGEGYWDGTIDTDNQIAYRRALAGYKALGVSNRDLDSAVSRSVGSGGWYSYLTGVDEMQLDINKLEKILAPLVKK